ncbi:MAG: hypothetical protein CVV13_04650 [Gammaproteobacteria bacterium HGW-Gammaproteobacteria-3]|jgi:hypothetical protein|nr:MAG: hypothetical protein CVV13_04650 [Gammaproteobacteria bacterium HGW-Gammaproteobacteria-3]
MKPTHTPFLILIVSFFSQLSGCTTAEPTRGDFMINQGASMVDVGVKWNEGNKLVEIGNDMIAQGRDNVNEGTKLIDKGNQQISEGKNLIIEGKKLLAESENTYRQRTKPATPVQEPEIEVFPLAE